VRMERVCTAIISLRMRNMFVGTTSITCRNSPATAPQQPAGVKSDLRQRQKRPSIYKFHHPPHERYELRRVVLGHRHKVRRRCLVDPVCFFCWPRTQGQETLPG
jgi:hypothetical protein